MIAFVPTMSLDDMSDEEHQASYDTEQDAAKRQHSLVDCISAMRSLAVTESELEVQHNHTGRGLETMMSQQTMQLARHRKLAVVGAVLDEQDDQFDRGYFDDDALAQASAEAGAAHDSIQRALEAAAADAAYVNTHIRPNVAIRGHMSSRSLSGLSVFTAGSAASRRGSEASVSSSSSSSFTSSKTSIVINQRMNESNSRLQHLPALA